MHFAFDSVCLICIMHFQTEDEPMDAITQAYRSLAAFANGIIPSRIDSEPTRNDGKAIIDDLMLLAEKVDAVIEAYGLELERHHVIDDHDLRHFRAQVSGALEGNATFCIENGVEDCIEARREAAE